MSHTFFATELEGVATWWRIKRRDGVAIAFTSHNRDLWLEGMFHRAAPGMLPSAIRRGISLELDSAEVRGALTHEAISAGDLAAGRYDGATVELGIVDWETLDQLLIYRGEVGEISTEGGAFEAELRSAKAVLELDLVPRSSPTCRAQFCGPGCTLSAAKFTHEAEIASVDLDANSVGFNGGPAAASLRDGFVRWIDGPHAGITMNVVSADATGIVFDRAIDQALAPGGRAMLREGCDHLYATCQSRFANSVNFQGEPFLPGNDLIARYPTSAT